MREATKTCGPLRPSTRIRVLLVAGQTMLRAALRAVISREEDMEVVGGAVDGRAAAALAVTTRPDVAVLDLSVAGPGGLVAGEAIGQTSPASRLLVIGHDPDPRSVRKALAHGFTGYLVKDADAAELLAAIRAVHQGRLFVSLGPAGKTARRGQEGGRSKAGQSGGQRSSPRGSRRIDTMAKDPHFLLYTTGRAEPVRAEAGAQDPYPPERWMHADGRS